MAGAAGLRHLKTASCPTPTTCNDGVLEKAIITIIIIMLYHDHQRFITENHLVPKEEVWFSVMTVMKSYDNINHILVLSLIFLADQQDETESICAGRNNSYHFFTTISKFPLHQGLIDSPTFSLKHNRKQANLIKTGCFQMQLHATYTVERSHRTGSNYTAQCYFRCTLPTIFDSWIRHYCKASIISTVHVSSLYQLPEGRAYHIQRISRVK